MKLLSLLIVAITCNEVLSVVEIPREGGEVENPGGELVEVENPGGAGGDPHFRTYDGTLYSYHGECDLVFARSEEFGDGVGLDLHARTDIVDGSDWSLISNAAIRIGKDIFELANDATYYFNHKKNPTFPLLMGGKYPITQSINPVEDGEKEVFYMINLGEPNANIHISLWKGMISVRVDAKLENTDGMLGIHGMTGMIGRDHATQLDDPNEMGQQWQVTDIEPMLFHEVRAPQYPERCVLPSTTSRRLRGVLSTVEMALVEKACADVDPDMKQFCKEDVLLTGDYKIGRKFAYSF